MQGNGHSSSACKPNNKLSSIGFYAFIVSVINAVINLANNINNNNNNRNNNNNDNNQNNNNINLANLNSGQDVMNSVDVGKRKRSLQSQEVNEERSYFGTAENLVSQATNSFMGFLSLGMKRSINGTKY